MPDRASAAPRHGSPRPGAGRARRAAVPLLLLLLALGGCSTILRLDPPPPAATETLPILGIPNARFWPDGPPDALLQEGAQVVARRRAAAESAARPGARVPDAHFLALSGGGDNGAFGAGLMVGWTQSGTRPVFEVVTGISAGALIAPFAFLGPDYDPQLREVFTAVELRDVLRVGSHVSTAFAAIFGEALADASPLYQLIARHADAAMLEAIAREYARGRLLLIGTTNLDVQRPVIWNIGAIAASGHPDALRLFRRILLASASIPGAFPPVLVDVEHAGRAHQEMHVDGGAAMQVFLFPPSLYLREVTRQQPLVRRRVVYVVRNGRIDVEWSSTVRGLFSIASRSLSTLLHFSGLNDIGRIYLTSTRDGVDFRLASIGPDFTAQRRGPFDRDFMQSLFAYGQTRGAAGEAAWADAPPAVTILDLPAAADRPRAAR